MVTQPVQMLSMPRDRTCLRNLPGEQVAGPEVAEWEEDRIWDTGLKGNRKTELEV